MSSTTLAVGTTALVFSWSKGYQGTWYCHFCGEKAVTDWQATERNALMDAIRLGHKHECKRGENGKSLYVVN